VQSARTEEDLTALQEEELRPKYDGAQVLSSGDAGPATLGKSSVYYSRIAVYMGLLIGLDRIFVAITCEVSSKTSLGHTFPSTSLAAVVLYCFLRLMAYRAPYFTKAIFQLAGPGIEFMATWRPLFYWATLTQLNVLSTPSVGVIGALLACRVAVLVGSLCVVLLGIAFWRVCAQYLKYGTAQPVPLHEEQRPWGSRQRMPHRAPTIFTPEVTVWQDAEGRTEDSATYRAWCRLAALWGIIAGVCLIPATIFGHSTGSTIPEGLNIAFEFSSSAGLYILAAYIIPWRVRCVIPSVAWFIGFGLLVMAVWAGLTQETLQEATSTYHRNSIAHPGAGDLIALPLGASVLSVVFEIVPAHTLTDRWAPVMVLVATLNACVSPFIAAAAAAATGLPQEYALPCTLQGLPAPMMDAVASHYSVNSAVAILMVAIPGLGGALLAAMGLGHIAPTGKDAEEMPEAHDWSLLRGIILGNTLNIHGTSALAQEGDNIAAAVATTTWMLCGILSTGFLVIPPVWDTISSIAK